MEVTIGVNAKEAGRLPMHTYKREGIQYYMTDLRYLNHDAIRVIINIIKHLAEHGPRESVKYRIPSDMSREKLRIINEILCGLTYRVVKRGQNGYSYTDTLLINACTEAVYNDGSRVMVYELIPHHAQVIYKMGQNVSNIRITDLIVEIAKEEEVRMNLVEEEKVNAEA